MTNSPNAAKSSSSGHVVGLACAGLWVLVMLARDVFSMAGLTYTLGLGDGSGLVWPEATAVLTWFLLVEACALAGVVGNYFTGQWRSSKLANLLFGHVTFLGWVFRALRASGRVVRSVARGAMTCARTDPAVRVRSSVDDDDFEGLVVDDAEAA